MGSLLSDFESWNLLLCNSVCNWFQIFDKSNWVSGPKGIFRDSATWRHCRVWSDDTASFQLRAFHNDWSETNVDVIINNGRSDVDWMLNIDVVANVNRKRKSLFRGPMYSLQNSVITDFSILSDSDCVIKTLGDTSKAKIWISGNKDITNNSGVWSDISGVGNDWLLVLQGKNVAMSAISFIAWNIVHFVASSLIQIEPGLPDGSTKVASEISKNINHKVFAISYDLHYNISILLAQHFLLSIDWFLMLTKFWT